MPPVQRYVSNELSHFCGRGKGSLDAQFETLLQILRSGRIRYPLPGVSEDIPAIGLVSNPNVRVTGHGMFEGHPICFCDIPIEDLSIHTTKYGRCGLSFPKAFLLPQGVNPVFYVAKDAVAVRDELRGDRFDEGFVYYQNLHKRLQDAIHGGRENEGTIRPETIDPDRLEELKLHTFLSFEVFSLLKFFDASRSDTDPENFYMEREWRTLQTVKFALDDVSRVFLPAEYARDLRSQVPDYHGQVTFV